MMTDSEYRKAKERLANPPLADATMISDTLRGTAAWIDDYVAKPWTPKDKRPWWGAKAHLLRGRAADPLYLQMRVALALATVAYDQARVALHEVYAIEGKPMKGEI